MLERTRGGRLFRASLLACLVMSGASVSAATAPTVKTMDGVFHSAALGAFGLYDSEGFRHGTIELMAFDGVAATDGGPSLGAIGLVVCFQTCTFPQAALTELVVDQTGDGHLVGDVEGLGHLDLTWESVPGNQVIYGEDFCEIGSSDGWKIRYDSRQLSSPAHPSANHWLATGAGTLGAWRLVQDEDCGTTGREAAGSLVLTLDVSG